ncbi:MAG: histidinol-phosphatase [Pseudoflavonifractor sp.]|nr:histidinol-phosphatase [Alloprevotella sp.]MCM1116613.1 histidinol-phosphatase [Pseudoflavonifractor sp.]
MPVSPSFQKILDELNPARPYTLHSHTQWCDGRATIDEMARAAHLAGMTHYGLSPHSPIPLPSSCNMSRTAVLEYLAEGARLKDEYEGKMKILLSMEIDYLSPQWSPAAEFFQDLPLDYRIGSVHFIPNQKGEYSDIDGSPQRFAAYLADRFGGDLRYVVDTFFDQTEAMIAAGGFDIIGHFDKIGYNASTIEPGIDRLPWYSRRMESLIRAIIDGGIAVEINTKAYPKTGRFFPAVEWWPVLIEARVPLVINSDAHFPELINAGRSEALAFLSALNN